MKKNNPIIFGTLLLTSAGIVTRIIGFFYRMFLSHNFGEENMGIYQLIAPAMVLTYSLCAAGIQTAISKLTAYQPDKRFLWSGMIFSCFLSILCSILIAAKSDAICTHIFLEKRCEPLLKVISLSFPLSSIHACINGYFYGRKKALSPALSQLIEQTMRVLCVMFLYASFYKKGEAAPLSITALGIVAGEAFAVLFSFCMLLFEKTDTSRTVFHSYLLSPLFSSLKQILLLAIPLSASKLVVNILQSVENIYIPNQLKSFGFTPSVSLSIFGVLTGMALPLILFPTAITNSVALMLLPSVAEAQAEHNHKKLQHLIKKTLLFCILLGFFCGAFFLLTGRLLGTLLFKSSLAGNFIITLSFICPFLYVNGSLAAIINGLGKTLYTLFTNLIALSIRLYFVFFIIPKYGITGYLWGLLLSQFSMTCLSFLFLRTLKKSQE